MMMAVMSRIAIIGFSSSFDLLLTFNPYITPPPSNANLDMSKKNTLIVKLQHNHTNYQGFPLAPPVETLYDAREADSRYEATGENGRDTGKQMLLHHLHSK